MVLFIDRMSRLYTGSLRSYRSLPRYDGLVDFIHAYEYPFRKILIQPWKMLSALRMIFSPI